MSVSLHPNTALGFNRPFTQLVVRALSVTNNNAQPVAFKVKTTAPKLYCVRPNSGRIAPGESVEVQVMLQPMKDEPPLSAKCKDKFLIQSTLITPEKETKGLQDIWNSTETSEEWKVYQQKLRVVYLPPEGQTVEEEDEPQILRPSNVSHEDARYETVKQHPGNGHAEEPRPTFSFEEEPVSRPSRELEEGDQPSSPPPAPVTEPQVEYDVTAEETIEERPAFNRTQSDAGGSINVIIHSSSPPQSSHREVPLSLANADIEEKYNQAQAEIQRLRALLAAVPDPSSIGPESTAAFSELRRRHQTSVLSDDGSATEVGTMIDGGAMNNQEGVPLQVVVMIALAVFIMTYLFF